MADGNQKMNAEELPIAAFRGMILETVARCPAVVLTAETGAGKSTQAPQYFLEAGYNLVVTQPRILAAATVAARVASERGEQVGDVVGVRTSRDRKVSTNTRCLFATDGLAMIRELMGQGNQDLLVLDEVHEWNLNIEVLVAWARMQILKNPKFKVVLMSATLEAEALAAYFCGAPVIEVPGRLFRVVEQSAGRDIETDVARLVREGRNVLVFQPGKAEITATIQKLKEEQRVNAEVLPLHGELTSEEQRACFGHYRRPKVIVATNVAQTSITIDDIDAVVDSGIERRIELVDGVEGLYLKPISKADAKQRRGRAGRTHEGIYIDHCPADEGSRLEFPKAEILRTRLDQTVLRLAEAGFDAEELEFFHQPDKAAIHEAKRALKALGCMDKAGNVTPKGKLVSKLPISVEYACMILEGERRGVLDDVLTIAAILEVNGITHTYKDKETRILVRKWLPLCEGETESNIMAQLAVFNAARNLPREAKWSDVGIHAKSFLRAQEVRKHLADALRNNRFRFGSSQNREDILISVCAGMVDHLYHREYGQYRNGDGVYRSLGQDSVIKAEPEWMVGLPVDIEIPAKYGTKMLNLVGMATTVKPEWLAEIAPQLVQMKTGLNPYYLSDIDSVMSTTEIYFQDRLISSSAVEDHAHPDAAKLFAEWVAAEMLG